MSTRTMARLHREPQPHTAWCNRDHTCGLQEHRGRATVIGPDTGGRAVVTRVRAGDRDYAEITMRVPLSRGESLAVAQLGTVLHHLRALFAAVAALRPDALTSRAGRRALDSRRAA